MLDATFKICVFGDSGVGKTTLINRYLTNLFQVDPDMTLGVEFHVKYVNINGKKVFLQIWDFAGEDRFRFILPNYIVGSSGCIFMYDITRNSSFKNFDNWLNTFKEGLRKNNNNIPLMMVGGKLDLQETREVDYEEAFELAKLNNLTNFIECSAKTGEYIEEIFISITQRMMKKAELT